MRSSLITGLVIKMSFKNAKSVYSFPIIRHKYLEAEHQTMKINGCKGLSMGTLLWSVLFPCLRLQCDGMIKLAAGEDKEFVKA